MKRSSTQRMTSLILWLKLQRENKAILLSTKTKVSDLFKALSSEFSTSTPLRNCMLLIQHLLTDLVGLDIYQADPSSTPLGTSCAYWHLSFS
jgi:hypothetical protein